MAGGREDGVTDRKARLVNCRSVYRKFRWIDIPRSEIASTHKPLLGSIFRLANQMVGRVQRQPGKDPYLTSILRGAFRFPGSLPPTLRAIGQFGHMRRDVHH